MFGNEQTLRSIDTGVLKKLGSAIKEVVEGIRQTIEKLSKRFGWREISYLKDDVDTLEDVRQKVLKALEERGTASQSSEASEENDLKRSAKTPTTEEYKALRE